MENKTLSGKDLSKRVPAMDERMKWINCFIKQSAEIAEYDIGDDQREYRSSEEIIDYSNKILGLNNVCAIRHDNKIPVEEFDIEEENF